MQSNNRHTLYSGLLDVVNRTADAFDSMDVAALTAMLHEHRRILSVIREKGDCQEEGLLKILENINSRVKLLGKKMRERRDDLCKQLLMAERKKHAMAVYTNDNLRAQPKRRPSTISRNICTR